MPPFSHTAGEVGTGSRKDDHPAFLWSWAQALWWHCCELVAGHRILPFFLYFAFFCFTFFFFLLFLLFFPLFLLFSPPILFFSYFFSFFSFFFLLFSYLLILTSPFLPLFPSFSPLLFFLLFFFHFFSISFSFLLSFPFPSFSCHMEGSPLPAPLHTRAVLFSLSHTANILQAEWPCLGRGFELLLQPPPPSQSWATSLPFCFAACLALLHPANAKQMTGFERLKKTLPLGKSVHCRGIWEKCVTNTFHFIVFFFLLFLQLHLDSIFCLLKPSKLYRAFSLCFLFLHHAITFFTSAFCSEHNSQLNFHCKSPDLGAPNNTDSTCKWEIKPERRQMAPSRASGGHAAAAAFLQC